jgi:hypothetical protein
MVMKIPNKDVKHLLGQSQQHRPNYDVGFDEDKTMGVVGDNFEHLLLMRLPLGDVISRGGRQQQQQELKQFISTTTKTTGNYSISKTPPIAAKALTTSPTPFPWKLHEMLDDTENKNMSHIVRWLPDNTSFKVYEMDAFVLYILPAYFRQTKYKSFQRQLNMWGFERILEGQSAGGYSHPFFLRGRTTECFKMKRTKIKGSAAARLKPIRCKMTNRRSLSSSSLRSSSQILDAANRMVCCEHLQEQQEQRQGNDEDPSTTDHDLNPLHVFHTATATATFTPPNLSTQPTTSLEEQSWMINRNSHMTINAGTTTHLDDERCSINRLAANSNSSSNYHNFSMEKSSTSFGDQHHFDAIGTSLDSVDVGVDVIVDDEFRSESSSLKMTMAQHQSLNNETHHQHHCQRHQNHHQHHYQNHQHHRQLLNDDDPQYEHYNHIGDVLEVFNNNNNHSMIHSEQRRQNTMIIWRCCCCGGGGGLDQPQQQPTKMMTQQKHFFHYHQDPMLGCEGDDDVVVGNDDNTMMSYNRKHYHHHRHYHQ